VNSADARTVPSLHGTALFGYLDMQCAFEGCLVVAVAGLLPLLGVAVPMLVLTLLGLPGFVIRVVAVRGREREQRDLDRLLDKVREGGLDRLSPGEAERLRSLSQRLRARRGAWLLRRWGGRGRGGCLRGPRPVATLPA